MSADFKRILWNSVMYHW